MHEAEAEIIAQEGAALEAWIRGDTGPYASLFAPDATYFDTYVPGRLEGRDAVARHLHGVGINIRAMLAARGKPGMDRQEMRNTAVQQSGDVAVLSYEWAGYIDAEVARWRATVVYRRQESGWRIIHAHWSLVQPTAS